LFFVISGFVIFMTLNRCRTPFEFIRSRVIRLFPAFWAALTTSAIVLYFGHLPGRSASFQRIAVNLSMVPGLLGVRPVDPVYWTLQIELCFYAIMLLLFATGHLRNAVWFMVGLLALGVMLRVFLPQKGAFLAHHPRLASTDKKMRELLILAYVPAFLIGMLIYENTRSPRRWHWAIVAACLAVSLAFSPTIDFVSLVLFGGIVYGAARRWLPILETRALLYLGFISYSLYLTHQDIGFVVIRALEGRGLSANTAIMAAVSIAVLVATALTCCIERPALLLLGNGKAGRSSREELRSCNK
jgi:peptidoglycan/LPS O-acetylase OafA/YrhL